MAKVYEVQVLGRILNVANGDLDNSDTSYTYIDLGNIEMSKFSIQFTLEATTISLEASNDTDATADASKTWTDVTSALFGVATETSSGLWIVNEPMPFSVIRVKRVTTNGTNACQLRVTRIS